MLNCVCGVWGRRRFLGVRFDEVFGETLSSAGEVRWECRSELMLDMEVHYGLPVELAVT